MKRVALAFASLVLLALPASAQFTIGGRYSNYSTEIGSFDFNFDTGRDSSFGVVGVYRNGRLVLNGQFDHDLQNGIGITDILPIDVAEYSRDRGEFAVGYSIIPNLDLEAGVRTEKITVGGSSFFGQDFFSDLSIDHQALLFGANAHSTTIRPVGWYVSARGYVGTAKFDDFGIGVDDDTTGYKIEAGIPIALGLSGWEISPGFEYERIESDKLDFKIDTNRFLINVAYTFGR